MKHHVVHAYMPLCLSVCSPPFSTARIDACVHFGHPQGKPHLAALASSTGSGSAPVQVPLRSVPDPSRY